MSKYRSRVTGVIYIESNTSKYADKVMQPNKVVQSDVTNTQLKHNSNFVKL